MPFKVNADRRHHIPRQRDRVTNWSEYDAALRQRGSLTVWFSDEAIAAWRAEPRTTRGGQPHYSALAITTALTLRVVFRLALRQTEGLIGSIIRLLGLDLAIPDHSTLAQASIIFRPVRYPIPLPGDVMTAIGIDLERHGRISQEDYGWGSVLPSGTAQPDLPLAEVYGPAVILTDHREVPLSEEGWSSTPTRPQTLAQLIRATR